MKVVFFFSKAIAPAGDLVKTQPKALTAPSHCDLKKACPRAPSAQNGMSAGLWTFAAPFGVGCKGLALLVLA